MSWKKTSSRVIEHTQGYQITLLAGTWKEPMDIAPSFPKSLKAYELATLIRQGLSFAHSLPVTGNVTKPMPKKPLRKKAPSRPILTLKKK